MIKSRDKKAQGYSTTEMMVFVLVLIMVFLLAFAAYNFYSESKKKAELLPGDVEIFGSICFPTGTSTPQFFCADFKRVTSNGKDQRVTCQYLKEKNLYPGLPVVDCSTFNIPWTANETCVNNGLYKGYLLNGVSCEEWAKRVAVVSGTWRNVCLNFTTGILGEGDSLTSCRAVYPSTDSVRRICVNSSNVNVEIAESNCPRSNL
jgi:hypothetical protein